MWTCAMFQKVLFASLVSGTDSRTDIVGRYCPLQEVWCFLTRKGLKRHQLQGGSLQLSQDTRIRSRL